MKNIYFFTMICLFSCSTNSVDTNKNSDVKTDDPHSKHITKKDLKIWPFTVDSGVLKCENGLYITFETGGKVYGINGAAVTNGGRNIEEIWAINEKQKKELMNLGVSEKNATSRIDISEVLDLGQKLCK